MSARTGQVLGSLLYGAAHVMDFTGALSRRSSMKNLTEDITLAWHEIYDGLPTIPAAQDGLSALTRAATHTVSPESGGERSGPSELSELGFRGPIAAAAAGITGRQLDYWARTGLIEPSIQAARGSGTQRLYSFRDILVLKVIKRLLDTGISLQQIRSAVEFLSERGSADLAQMTLMSDGVSVYACTSPDDVVALLRGGHGVFGIALARVWQEVEASLSELPSEHVAGQMPGEPLGSEEHPQDSVRSRRTAEGGAA